MDTVTNSVNELFLETQHLENGIPQENALAELSSSAGKKKTFLGFCTKCSANGDLTIVYGNTTCTMKREDLTPIIQADGLVHKSTCQNKVGTHLNFRVTKVENDIIYVSRKEIISEYRKTYIEKLIVNNVVNGIITNINENIGCFVDIGADYTAVLPKKNLEHVFVNKVTDHVNIGDKVQAVIVDLVLNENNSEFTEIVLSKIPLLPTYEELTKDYAPGDVVIGQVSSITPRCIYTQLTKHLNVTCSLTPNLRLTPGQMVRIRLKQIKSTTENKMVGNIISAL